MRGLRNASEIERVLDDVERLAGHLDLDVDLADARDALAVCGQLGQERRAVAADAERQLAVELAAGTIDMDDAAQRAAAIAQLSEPGPLRSAVRQAEDTRLNEARQAARTAVAADALFTACRNIAEGAVTAIRDLRPELEGIRDADTAMAVGVNAAGAWSRYQAALARFDRAHDLVDLLRGVGWLPAPETDTPDATRYGRPDLRTAQTVGSGGRWRNGDYVLELLDEATDEWEPGLFTADEADERHAEQLESEREAARPDSDFVPGKSTLSSILLPAR